MKELKRKYYQTELIRIHRGNSRGVFINAKPLYVISLIECIDKGILLENKIEYPAPEIEKVYLETCEKYEPGRKLSPFILPHFYRIILRYSMEGNKVRSIETCSLPFGKVPQR